MNKKIFMVASMLFFCFSVDAFAVTVILKSGQAIDGAIVEKTDTYIKMDFNGVPLTYYLVDIESIDGEPVKIMGITLQNSSDISPREARNTRIDKATEMYIEKALSKIPHIRIAEYNGCKMLMNYDANVYKEKFDLILLAMNFVVPQLREEFSFRAPEQKIRIIALDDGGYRIFLNETGNEYLKMPYGFAFKNVGTIVVNMDLGVGTLLHELMYVLIYDDMGEVPAWIEEGFACLYEGFGWQDGKIYMKSNWRLPLFKQVIDTPNYIKLSDLMKLGKITEEEQTRVAAHARYLMYYLHEKNLLKKFYKEYKATRSEDYEGVTALQRTVGMNIEQFEEEWLTWMRNLSAKKEGNAE